MDRERRRGGAMALDPMEPSVDEASHCLGLPSRSRILDSKYRALKCS